MIIYNKITNKINPNAILGEVALFETEQHFLNAKQQWITDNTIINELSAFDNDGAFIEIVPENSILEQNLLTLDFTYSTDAVAGQVVDDAPEGYKINEDGTEYIEIATPQNTKYIQTILPDINNYQYRFATEDDKKEYAVDYLEFKKKNEKRTDIVLTFKSIPTIENTERKDIDAYLLGQIQEELEIMPYMYFETTGDLLNEFIAKEQAIIDNNNKTQIQDLYKKTVAKVIATQNAVLSNLTGIINGITLNKLSVDRLIELCTLIDKSDEKTNELFSLNCAVYFNVDKKDIGGKYLTIVSTIKKNVHNNSANIIAKALILASNQVLTGLQTLFDSITPELLDGDNVKDGKISIEINDNNIKVFNGATNEEITQDTAEIQRLINLTI